MEGLNINQVDYNNDGYLDVFVMRGAWFSKSGTIPNSLLKNNGDGTFEDVTKEVGLLSFFQLKMQFGGILIWMEILIYLLETSV